jgi:hypothetical protein
MKTPLLRQWVTTFDAPSQSTGQLTDTFRVSADAIH